MLCLRQRILETRVWHSKRDKCKLHDMNEMRSGSSERIGVVAGTKIVGLNLLAGCKLSVKVNQKLQSLRFL